MANTLTVTGSFDYSGETITDTNEILFNTLPFVGAGVTFTASQFGAGLISNSLLIFNQSPGFDEITVNLGAATSFSAAGWSLQSGLFPAVEINGSANDDTIIGSSGNDQIQGGAGGDTLAGGPGDDTYYLDDVHEVTLGFSGQAAGGSGGFQSSPQIKFYAYDTVIENSDEGYDTVIVDSIPNGTAYTLPANVESGVVEGLPGFVLTGNDLNNALYVSIDAGGETLNGGGGNDSLLGGAYADTLIGGAGSDSLDGGPALNPSIRDILTGGADADFFVLDDTNGAIPEITDYDQGNTGSYSAAEGDVLGVDVTPGYNAGQAPYALAQVVEDPSGAYSLLQVDYDGTANGVQWTTVALLDGIHNGDSVLVQLVPNGYLTPFLVSAHAVSLSDATTGFSVGFGAGTLSTDGAGSTAPLTLRAGSGPGTNYLFGGSGSDNLIAGTGTTVMTGGAGANLFEIDASLTDNASTSITITDFNANDLVQFLGISSADISAAVNTAVYSGADEVLTLPDGSTVTFDGVGPGGVPLSNLLGSSSGLTGSPDIAFSPGDTLIGGTTPYGTGTFVTVAYGTFMGGPNNTFTGGAAGQFTITGDIATVGYKYIDLVGDTLIGGAGASTLTGGAGSYAFVGGVGDTADYTAITTTGIVAIIQGGGGTVNKGGANGSNTLAGVPNLVDNGTSRSNGDVFYVDGGENVTANSNNFNYLIELSAGVNLAYGTSFTGITEFVSNVGTNTVDFSADTSFAYVFGSTGNDTLTLGSGGGYMFGEGGTNILNGGANATNLFVGGDGGSDTMNGGTGGASNFYFVDGNDQVNGAGAFNTMIELVSGVTVQLDSAQYQDVQEFVANSGTNAVTVANTDSDFVYLYGGAGNDTLSTRSGGGYLFGEGGTNVLTGGGGLNVFVADGASGVDTMDGGSGSNIYYIDNNSIVHGAGTFNTVIELQQNATLTLGSAQLGTDVQQVILNGGTNTVDFRTATSTEYLYGGAGNDTLFGGTGNDFLYGGAGTNTFGFQTGWGQDTIEDWTAGTNDQIDLTALAGLGVHAITDLTQSITAGNDVITSSHTGTNSITLMGVGTALSASSFHFA